MKSVNVGKSSKTEVRTGKSVKQEVAKSVSRRPRTTVRQQLKTAVRDGRLDELDELEEE